MVTRKAVYGLAAATVSAFGVASAHAATIIPGGYPDVKSNHMQITYSTATQQLLITSANTVSTDTLKPSSDSSTWINGNSGNFVLTAHVVDNSGALTFSNVNFTVGDSNNSNYFTTTAAPTFSWTALGGSSVETLDFKFATGSGTYGTHGLEMQFHSALSGDTNLADLFANTFDNTTQPLFYANSFADTSAAPEPASLAMLGLALPLLMRRRKA